MSACCCEIIQDNFCKYKTTRHVTINNKYLASIYWFTLLLVFLYVVIFTIIIEEGYNTYTPAVGIVTTKTHGCARIINSSYPNNGTYQKLFDAVDVAYDGINTLYITTAMTQTVNQIQGICDNIDPDDGQSKSCTQDSDCNPNDKTMWGWYAGTCGSNGYCQNKGWCPVEYDGFKDVLDGVGDFNITLKIDVKFVDFNISVSNYEDGKIEMGKNKFKLNYFLNQANIDIDNVATNGANMLITIDFTCAVNNNKELKKCVPVITYDWLDSRTQSNGKKAQSLFKGINFRKKSYYTSINENGSIILTRNMRKEYGINIGFIVTGKGKKFSFPVLSLTVGAGLAYLGIASIFTDIVLRFFIKEKNIYEAWKNQTVGRRGTLLSDPISAKNKTDHTEPLLAPQTNPNINSQISMSAW